MTLYALLAAELPFGATPGDALRRRIKEINYTLKDYFSNDAQTLLMSIFKEADYRISLNDVTETNFYMKHEANMIGNPNFVNTEFEAIAVDDKILQQIEDCHSIPRDVVKESLNCFKLNASYGLYFLTVRKNGKKGI